ncbi:MAG: SIS domain-containing protein [Verrucomicrobia bacterium]|nr:SIS domain-containing protein [Verrucomicrobiota bacterium]
MNDIDHLCQRLPSLENCRDSIQQATDLLIQSFQQGNKLLLCGNGGSAADCEHIAGELIKRFSAPRPLPSELSGLLGTELAQNLHGGLPALSLPSMIGFHTAFANDDDPAYAFAQQVIAFGKTGDVLLAISTSGNSQNLIHAVHTAKALGLKTIALTGENGGKLAPLCDLAILAPASDTPRVQELHLPIYHSICTVVENTLFPESI